MKIRVSLPCFLLAIAIMGCDPRQPLGPLVTDLPGRPIIIIEDRAVPSFPRDPAAIESTWISGDNLTLIVRFHGGHAVHDFNIYVPAGFLESNPLQCYLTLSHDAPEDRDTAVIRARLSFSLIPLRQEYGLMYSQSHDWPATVVLTVFEPHQVESRLPSVEYDFSR